MIIKKSSLDTLLILSIMFAAVLPEFLAKPLVCVFAIFIFLKIIFSDDLFLYFNKKIIILLLFIPGFLGAILTAPEHIIRFLGFFLILFGFPFSNFKIKSITVIVSSSIILLYLIITQFLLLIGNTTILNFRDFWYPSDWSQLFNYGHTNDIFKNIFYVEDHIRAGGLYYNPNTLAGIVLLYYFIYDFSWRSQNQASNQNKKYWKIFFHTLIFFLVFFSLLSTKSRTMILSFLAYVIFKNINFHALFLRYKKKRIFFFNLILFLGFLSILLYNSKFANFKSIDEKFFIFTNYLTQTNLYQLVIGGNFNVHFDFEWGHWIGAAGFLGIVAFFVFYKMVCRFEPQIKTLIFSLILISFGSTLFYNLQYTATLIPLFIIRLSQSN